ncbi:GNAT family N-acetyltransferase [Streptomyces hundungensis]|uniref:GNAT family N-acetyltransferase n=1 Tax=Streptomyces hundungensis TaxID=1077946 RepID=UPI0033E06B82
MEITWRRIDAQDFPLLGIWLQQPHVKRWWNHETTAEAVARDFGPAARGEEPSEDLLAFLDGRPVGLVQRSRLRDYPEYLAELTAIIPVPDGAMTIDYVIGDPLQTGQGVGTAMIQFAIERPGPITRPPPAFSSRWPQPIALHGAHWSGWGCAESVSGTWSRTTR